MDNDNIEIDMSGQMTSNNMIIQGTEDDIATRNNQTAKNSGANNTEINQNEKDKKSKTSSATDSNSKKNETGDASLLRLFNAQLSGQISWTFVFALIGIIFLSIALRFNFVLDTLKKKHLFFWTTWALPMVIYFSYTTGIFHRYYLSMLAPALAALTAMGAVTMWDYYKKGKKLSLFLPFGIAANGLMQCIFLNYYWKFDGWLINIVLIGSMGVAIILLMHLFGVVTLKEKLIKGIAIIGVALQLIAPTVWSSTLLVYPINNSMPYAGPELITDDMDKNTSEEESLMNLIAYLESHYNGETFLVAVPSANNYGSRIILNSDYTTMSMGGYNGSDNILDVASLKELIETGAVRYFLISDSNKEESTGVTSYIVNNGTLIESNSFKIDNMELYDMKAK
jgi:4-amino-4-deoxy-L-arabinose transferase-like glycosyltransferase